jgi:hypothetical protein
VVEEGVERDCFGERFGDGQVFEEGGSRGAKPSKGIERCGEKVEVVGVAYVERGVRLAFLSFFGCSVGVGVWAVG